MREWLERAGRGEPIPTKRTAAQVLRELREGKSLPRQQQQSNRFSGKER